MNNYEDFKIVYKIKSLTSTSFEMTLEYLDKELEKFLEEKSAFTANNGVYIICSGSHLVLGPRNPPSGRPEGLILPQLQGSNSSCTSERNQSTMDKTPRSDTEKVILDGEPGSERIRGEGSLIEASDSMHFKTEVDRVEYVNGICRAMSDLTQAFLDMVDTTHKDRALTLIILN